MNKLDSKHLDGNQLNNHNDSLTFNLSNRCLISNDLCTHVYCLRVVPPCVILNLIIIVQDHQQKQTDTHKNNKKT